MKKHLMAAALLLSQLTAVNSEAAPVRERPPVSVEDRELGSVVFAQLLVKVESTDEIAGLTKTYVNKFNNHLRAAGYNIPGTESSVFKEETLPNTDYMIAGTITEFECSNERKKTCGLGVLWEVLDRRSDQVVYKLSARHEEMLLRKMKLVDAAEALLLGTLDSLMAREKFVHSLEGHGESHVEAQPAYDRQTLRACPEEPRAMPKGSEHALNATVLVKVDKGIGSGVFISPDGYLLTAAHVVTEDKVEIRQKNGKSFSAEVVRLDEAKDVALLRIIDREGTTPCLPLNLATAPAGEDVYALGSPAGEELSFSISRGIVSGARTMKGTSYVQTDAAINPGNSGGPLVNSKGEVIAIASWKVASEEMEGLGFGVPSSTALNALQIVLGDHTDTVAVATRRRVTSDSNAIVDEPDNNWYYIGEDAPGRTPTWVPTTRLFGYLTAGAGLSAIAATWIPHLAGATTGTNFGTYRLVNTIGWGALLAGTGMVVSSHVLRPDNRAPSEMNRSADGSAAVGLASTRLGLGLGTASLNWKF